jgi:hypothetical protein
MSILKRYIILQKLYWLKAFGGGFKHHDFVNSGNVKKLYEKLKSQPEIGGFIISP